MKVLKNNWWNRIFHGKKLQRQEEEKEATKNRLRMLHYFLSAVEIAEGLMELMELHKSIWRSGFQMKNIGPDEYGMFRTKDIANMIAEEVFLGNIYGLWTFPIPEWEKRKEEKYGANGFGINPEIPLYNFPLNQYKQLLLQNLRRCEMAENMKLKDLTK